MSRTMSKRLLAQSPRAFSELAPLAKGLRLFSRSATRAAEDRTITAPPITELQTPAPRSPSLNPASRSDAPGDMNMLARHFANATHANNIQRNNKTSALSTNWASDGSFHMQSVPEPVIEPHHFHINATRHNTHITLTDPKRNPILSLSCGNLGFRHAARKHYDSAFQLASFVMTRMQDRGINAQIKQLEVVLRGFGAGREAVTKALLGLEGKNVRHKIVKVADATRLKFGGTRSKKPRRLG